MDEKVYTAKLGEHEVVISTGKLAMLAGGAVSVRIGDTIWRVTGPDCAAGSRVRIARAEGATLFVEQTTD